MPETSHDEQRAHYKCIAVAIRYLQAQAHRQPSLGEVAAEVGLSDSHFQRLFSQWAGVSPKRFLQYLTKERAKQALRDSRSLLDATLDAGISSPGRLHDLMITCEAMTPGQFKTQGAGLTIRYGSAPTPFGLALIGQTERGVCSLAFYDDGPDTHVEALVASWPAATFVPDESGTAARVANLFSATPPSGPLHLLLQGSNFQLKVWEALLRVGSGQRVSYSQLAQLAGSPQASRAVGSALAANRIGYLIPCHRVIRESGEVGQFRWGAERKLAMQGWEAAHNSLANKVIK